MAKGRQQYFADEVSIQKEAREFAIEEQLKAKIDSVEEGAQVNVIETVKVNGEALIPDEEKAVDVDVPLVEDNLYSVDTEAALSARQGKVLYDYIQNLQSRGRYLSNWNSATGLPTTNPSESPYLYRAGDYFLVSNVSTGTNYKPDGSQYEIGVASETVETDTVMVSDMYIYDGSAWQLIKNGERPIVIDDRMDIASTNPVENRVITQALRTKQDTISDLQTIREGAAAGATAVQPGDNLSTLSGDSDDIVEGSSHLFMTPQERTKLGNQSGVNTGDETQATIMAKLGAASATTNGYLTSTDWNTFNDKQDAIQDLQTIRDNAQAGKDASDEIATYGDIVTHDVNEFATAAQGAKADTALQSGDNVSELVNDAGYITDAYHDDTKQDKLTAGNNITIRETCEWDTQGPAPDGFHIPSKDEWEAILPILFTTFSLPSREGTLRDYLKMTPAGYRWMGGSVSGQGSYYYWTSTASDTYTAFCLTGYSGMVNISDIARSNATSIRCFKNAPVVPDNSWTTLYDGSSVATGAGIFHNTTDGLISISGDGVTWYTIQDKNLGATEVFNGGTVTDANSGYFYQWGNNYGFAHSGDVTTSSTQVDASNYGPGNYYNSSTFITRRYEDESYDWSSTLNNNLWGGVTQGQGCRVAISATDTTYVAGDFDIKDLADSTGKRAEWDAKQDALDLGANLSWGQDGKLNATDTTYTAGPGISISQNNVISNTRTSAEWGNITGTLSDQTDLQSALDEKQNSFNVVDTLPDVSQADMNATYYLSTGDGKYEEWIVVEKEEYDLITFGADPECDYCYIPSTITFSEPTTLTLYNKVGDGRIEFVARDVCDEITGECTPQVTDYKDIAYADAGEVCLAGGQESCERDGPEGWYRCTQDYIDSDNDNEYVGANSYTFPAGIVYNVEVYDCYRDCYDEVTFSKGSSMVKRWVKVGEQWGSITGNLSDQTDLQAALDLKADLTDVRTKIFEINDTAQVSAFKPAIDWIAAGNNSIIKYINTEDGSYNYFNFASKHPYPRSSTNGVGYYFISADPDAIECYVDDIISGLYVIVEGDGTVSSVGIDRVNIDSLERDVEELNRSVLKKNNTQTYTPTGDYNPATKKYVDDAVAGISGGKNDIIVSDTEPSDETVLWINNSSYASEPPGMYYYDDNEGNWQPIGGIISSDTEPDSHNKLWFKSGQGVSDDELFYYDDNEDSWQPLGGIIKSTSTPASDEKLWLKDGQGIDYDELFYYDDRESSWQSVGGIIKSTSAPSNYDKLWLKDGQGIDYDKLFYYDDEASSWLPIGSNSWGNITGTLSDQIDLQNALDAKMEGMTILSYGHSTWQDFLDAYNNNRVVYCRASSGSNPGSGTQGRLAFMAYVNNAENPTEVEFQYYRSRSNHDSAANQLDEVYVYKLVPASGGTWTVTIRNTGAKAVAGTGISLTFGGGNMTISNTGVTSVNGQTGAVTTPTYSAGTGLTLNNNEFAVDTATIATKADLANFAGFLVVAQLPTTDIKTNIIYLLGPVGTGADKYEEYIYSNNNWIMIGDTTIDLSPYFHKTNDDSDDIIEGSTNLFLTSAERTILGNTSGTNTGDETKTSIQTKLGAASSSNSGYLTSTDYDTIMSSLSGGGDMSYSDFNWQAKTGATITLDLASTITPSANFTVNAPSTIKDGQTYILRVSNGATAYTMTLGTNVTNPYSVDTTLTASGIDQFVFLAIGGNLELQPNISGGGDESNTKTFFLSSTSDLATAQAAYDWYAAGKNPIVVLNNMGYLVSVKENNRLLLTSSYPAHLNQTVVGGYSVTQIYDRVLGINLSGDTVTSVQTLAGNGRNFLKTDVNYTTPYIPQYDGSPATKKYVDDNVNTKTFYLSGRGDTEAHRAECQPIVDWYLSGKMPIVKCGEMLYVFRKQNGSNTIEFEATRSTVNAGNTQYTRIIEDDFVIYYDISTHEVTHLYHPYSSYNNGAKVLEVGQNYSNPFTPQYDGEPATKKYVDDNDTVISGDSGVKYTIKVSNTAPASGTASNIITIVTN